MEGGFPYGAAPPLSGYSPLGEAALEISCFGREVIFGQGASWGRLSLREPLEK